MSTKASRISLYMIPTFYTLLAIYFSLSLQLWQIVLVFFTYVIGAIAGGWLNRNIAVRKLKGKFQYNRHPVTFAVWVIAVAFRVIVELFFNVQIAVFVMTAVLAFSTGLLVSESRILHSILKVKKRQGQGAMS